MKAEVNRRRLPDIKPFSSDSLFCIVKLRESTKKLLQFRSRPTIHQARFHAQADPGIDKKPEIDHRSKSCIPFQTPCGDTIESTVFNVILSRPSSRYQQSGFDLIPKGTVVPVRMTLKPGGYDDPSQGWGGGYATESFETGSVYLAAEFVVTAGDHAKRKMWSNIGLHSKKGPTWGQMGRSFIRAALNSARNVHPQDNSPQAAAARRIQGFHELDGLEFLARVDIEKDGKGQDRNVVKIAVEPDHPDYAKLMGVPPKAPGSGHSGAPAQAAAPAYQAPAPQRAPVTGKPSWAQ